MINYSLCNKLFEVGHICKGLIVLVFVSFAASLHRVLLSLSTRYCTLLLLTISHAVNDNGC